MRAAHAAECKQLLAEARAERMAADEHATKLEAKLSQLRRELRRGAKREIFTLCMRRIRKVTALFFELNQEIALQKMQALPGRRGRRLEDHHSARSPR